MSADTTNRSVAAILAGHIHPDEAYRLADQIRIAVLTDTVRSLSVYAARERAVQAESDDDHRYWDGVGHAARLITKAANDLEGDRADEC